MTGSPFSTLSPGFTNHSAIVPSSIDSASSGIIISFTGNLLLRSWGYVLLLAVCFVLLYGHSVRLLQVKNALDDRHIATIDPLSINLLNNLVQNSMLPCFSALLEPKQPPLNSVIVSIHLQALLSGMDRFARYAVHVANYIFHRNDRSSLRCQPSLFHCLK